MYKRLGYSVYRTVIEYYSASNGEPDEDAYGESSIQNRNLDIRDKNTGYLIYSGFGSRGDYSAYQIYSVKKNLKGPLSCVFKCCSR